MWRYLLSNLPEAAGVAKDMAQGGQSNAKVFALWGTTAAILTTSAPAGNLLLADVLASTLALIRCFAGGAVVASLAAEVFPKAFKEDSYWSAIATTLGLLLALYLNQLNRG